MSAKQIDSEDKITEHNDKILAVGKERINLRTATNKLQADIGFLRERIERMKQFTTPNEATLGIYEEMLRNRESVLAWLEEQKKSDAGNRKESGAKKLSKSA